MFCQVFQGDNNISDFMGYLFRITAKDERQSQETIRSWPEL